MFSFCLFFCFVFCINSDMFFSVFFSVDFKSLASLFNCCNFALIFSVSASFLDIASS